MAPRSARAGATSGSPDSSQAHAGGSSQQQQQQRSSKQPQVVDRADPDSWPLIRINCIREAAGAKAVEEALQRGRPARLNLGGGVVKFSRSSELAAALASALSTKQLLFSIYNGTLDLRVEDESGDSALHSLTVEASCIMHELTILMHQSSLNLHVQKGGILDILSSKLTCEAGSPQQQQGGGPALVDMLAQVQERTPLRACDPGSNLSLRDCDVLCTSVPLLRVDTGATAMVAGSELDLEGVLPFATMRVSWFG